MGYIMKDYSDIPVVQNHLNLIHSECIERLKKLDNYVIKIIIENNEPGENKNE